MIADIKWKYKVLNNHSAGCRNRNFHAVFLRPAFFTGALKLVVGGFGFFTTTGCFSSFLFSYYYTASYTV